jgi:hypothetical protein
VNKYKDFYENFGDATQTLTAFDMTKLTGVIENMDLFINELLNVKPWSEINNVYMNIDFYYNRTSIDLVDFIDKLQGVVGNANLISKGIDLKQAIRNFVIANFNESGHTAANGLSVYFPLKSDYNPKYSNNLLNIDFSADTKWDDFLLAYFNEGNTTNAFDPYEPNDVFVQAYGPITSGFSYNGFIQDKNDLDIYKFTTGSEFNLDVKLNVPADLDLLLVVKEGDNYFKVDSSYSNELTDEHINRTNLPAGDYFILVLPYEVSNSPYQLTADITGGSGIIDLESSYDDGEPEYGIYSEITDFSEGVACLFRLPVAPVKLKGFLFYLYSLDTVPGNGNDGSFWVLGSDYYGSFIPNDYVYVTPASIGWNYVDLSQYDVTLNSDFFGGMVSDRFNTPAIGWDTTSSNGLNLIYTDLDGVKDWYVSNGTFFIRTVITVTNNTTGIEETVTINPSSYSIENAYPNPFNPTTTISYSLPEEARVNLEIFNLLGQKVTTLFEGKESVGSYKKVWNAENYPSGIYFYKLKVEGKKAFEKTKKLILMK